jgi:hypothetical protein
MSDLADIRVSDRVALDYDCCPIASITRDGDIVTGIAIVRDGLVESLETAQICQLRKVCIADRDKFRLWVLPAPK